MLLGAVLTQVIGNDGEGSLRSSRTSKYDKCGNEVERISYDADKTMINKRTMEYDSRGNPFKKQSYKWGNEFGGTLLLTLETVYKFTYWD